MKSAAQAIRPKPAPAPELRRVVTRPRAATLTASPRYLRASVRLGGLNDPEEREAEHAAGVIASGGCHQVRDPGGSTHLRAAGEAAPARAAAQPSVVDPGASGRIRRVEAAEARDAAPVRAAVQPPVIDPGAAGRVRRLAAPAPIDPGGTTSLRATGAGEAETVRRAAPGLPSLAIGTADAEAVQRIERARSAAAPPLAPAVRARLEDGLGEPLDGVRVHTGPTARAAAAAIGARAYTEGERITLGHGESENDLRLMAHEATHVAQNRRAAGIARGMSPATSAIRTEASAAAKSEVRPAESATVPASAGPIRRSIVGDALDYIADKANFIPGFRLFTIILGVNPINMAPVDRSGANILRAAVEIIPFGGMIVKALDSYGVFEKAGAWVDQQIATLKMTGAAIRDALMEFIDSLHLSDIFHPGDVWDRAKRIFTEPIDRIIAFFKALADGLIALIKDAILRPLAALAAKTRAWDLLIAVLGKNPITGDAVPRTAETLIGGFMKLIGQEEVWERIKKANALGRAWAWFQKALTSLLAFVEQIPALFISTLKSFQISDLLDLPGAFARVAAAFGNFVGKFISWAGHTVLNLLEIVFDVVSPGAFAYVKKTGAALGSILRNPLPFVGNLVKAAKLGFQNFADNVGAHLKAGLIDWLTGSLTGIYIPKEFSLAEFGKFALSVLGIAWAQIRGKIVKALGPNGEAIMKGLETGFAIVTALVTGGAAAAWDLIKEKLTDLKDMVIDGIIGFVVDSIVKKAIPKLISMFIPGAGFISAIISIYDTIMVFVAKLAKIAAVVMAFVESIIAIAAGRVASAAARVEGALANLLSLAISFLAGFLGLGNITEKVKAVIEKVRTAVDKALDATVGWLIGKAKTLFGKLFGKEKKESPGDAASSDAQVQEPVRIGSEEHTVRADLTDEGVVFKMASNGFADFSKRLDEIASKDETELKKLNLQSVLTSLSADIASIKALTRQGAEDKSLTKIEKNQARKKMNDFVVQIVRKLSALGVKYTFGSGQNAQVGDTVILYPEAIGATVAAIGVAAGPTVGVRVKKPSGEITINTYDQYGKTGSGGWELVGPGMKPVFVAFSGSAGPGARQVKGVSQLYPPGHAGASANPPGLNQPAKKDPTKITSIRGHLVGDQFGGPGGLNNIVAMTPTANVGPNGMSSIELKAHDEIAVHGRIIDYTATPIYSAPYQTNAPESISVTFSVRDVMGKPVGSGQSATVPNYI